MPRNTSRAARGNTSAPPLQEGGMPTALPQTIAPPFAYREAPPRAGRFIREQPAKTEIKGRSNQLAFQLFVDENRHLFVDYIQRRLDGPHKNAAEDALQEGLLKIWHEWEDWPTDPEQQIRFARQSLRLAALEAVRKRTGRDGSPRSGEVVVDFEDIDSATPKTPNYERLARDLGRAIAEQSLVKDQIGYLEKASLVAAIATLTDLEQRVLFMTARGDDCREIADELGVTHQQTREALMRARRLCRMLIEHADGQKVSEKEARLLWQYADGELSGKRARELKRHISHCTACQRLLGLEESVQKAGMHAVLPIPLLLLAAGKPAAVAAGLAPTSSTTAAASSGSAASVVGAGGSGGVQLGQTILASQVPTAFTGSVTAGITAKIGLALGTLAAAGSMGGVYKLAHDKQQQREASRTPPAQVVSVTTPATAFNTGMKRAATPPSATGKKTAAKKTAPKKQREKAAANTPTTSSQSQQATTQTQIRSSTPTKNASRPQTSSSSNGGEFVIGSR